MMLLHTVKKLFSLSVEYRFIYHSIVIVFIETNPILIINFYLLLDIVEFELKFAAEVVTNMVDFVISNLHTQKQKQNNSSFHLIVSLVKQK